MVSNSTFNKLKTFKETISIGPIKTFFIIQ